MTQQIEANPLCYKMQYIFNVDNGMMFFEHKLDQNWYHLGENNCLVKVEIDLVHCSIHYKSDTNFMVKCIKIEVPKSEHEGSQKFNIEILSDFSWLYICTLLQKVITRFEWWKLLFLKTMEKSLIELWILVTLSASVNSVSVKNNTPLSTRWE